MMILSNGRLQRSFLTIATLVGLVLLVGCPIGGPGSGDNGELTVQETATTVHLVGIPFSGTNPQSWSNENGRDFVLVLDSDGTDSFILAGTFADTQTRSAGEAEIDVTTGIPDASDLYDPTTYFNATVSDDVASSDPSARIVEARVGAYNGADFVGIGVARAWLDELNNSAYMEAYVYSTADTVLSGSGSAGESTFDNVTLVEGWNSVVVELRNTPNVYQNAEPTGITPVWALLN